MGEVGSIQTRVGILRESSCDWSTEPLSSINQGLI